MGVQLAKNAGLTVYTTASSRTLDFVKQFHPDKIIDYQTSAWEDDPELLGVDAVFDTVGTSGNFEKAKKVLKPTGGFLTIASAEAGTNPLGHPPLSYVSNYVLRGLSSSSLLI
jgi:NADPH:quinone reductase-like Zn-dependent oxidoreductase